ncbi:hypothetical protein AWQ22_15760 (plasmid) [Picosynechococcus sp. PCC 7117]|nr:hypothetical protein AWQ22_15760 [Picosynechococcus sp. PCC 7117]
MVVFDRGSDNFEVIDGQQRLTTLSLLAAYLKEKTSTQETNWQEVEIDWFKRLNLRFDSRPNSQATIEAIFRNRVQSLDLESPKKSNIEVLHGYKQIQKILPQKLTEYKVAPQDFSMFLFEKVQIMQVKVPKDTDLNHYFEIMNNRGEQLEKHEVLKSRMMEHLKDDKLSQNCLDLVWEACANMEGYVQMGFSKSERNAIFGAENWDRLTISSFQELQEKIDKPTNKSSTQNIEETLDEILGKARKNINLKDEEISERFNSVVSFPNFLIHVLRVQTESDISLDDKKLLLVFEEYIFKSENTVEKIKNFVFHLLRCKFLYDQYIVKREFINGKDSWSLKRMAKDQKDKPYYKNTFEEENIDLGDINKCLLMLLSAFHVSNPSQNYGGTKRVMTVLLR